MRPLINSGQASHYLSQLPQWKPSVCSSKKMPDLIAHYQKMLASRDLKDCLLLLKEIHCKQKELECHHKKLGQVDSRYQKIVERLVCEELAAALHTMPHLIKERLYAAMENEAPSQSA